MKKLKFIMLSVFLLIVILLQAQNRYSLTLTCDAVAGNDQNN